VIKEYRHKIEVVDEETQVVSSEYRVYRIKDREDGWFELSCDGEHIALVVSEEECRRIVWTYWTNLGLNMPYLESESFTVVET